MQILGDVKNSNKFYIYLEHGGIAWVSSIETAKLYVSNTRYTEWYNKPIYCTNEDIVEGYDGNLYVKSQCPTDPNIKIKYDNKSMFVESAKKHIKADIDEVIENSPFESLEDAYTYNSSKIKELKALCKEIFDFRDNLILFYQKILKKYEKEFEITDELLDLSYVYEDFLTNCPEFTQKDVQKSD